MPEEMGMAELEEGMQTGVLNLEGPFLTLEEFLVAERIKEKIERASRAERGLAEHASPGGADTPGKPKKKKKKKKTSRDLASSVPLEVMQSAKDEAGGTFALTHVGGMTNYVEHASYDREVFSSPKWENSPKGSYMMHSEKDKGTAATFGDDSFFSEFGATSPIRWGDPPSRPPTRGTDFPSRPPTRGGEAPGSEYDRPGTSSSIPSTTYSAATTAAHVPGARSGIKGHMAGLPVKKVDAATQSVERAPEGAEAEAVLRRYHFSVDNHSELLQPLLTGGGKGGRGGDARRWSSTDMPDAGGAQPGPSALKGGRARARRSLQQRASAGEEGASGQSGGDEAARSGGEEIGQSGSDSAVPEDDTRPWTADASGTGTRGRVKRSLKATFVAGDKLELPRKYKERMEAEVREKEGEEDRREKAEREEKTEREGGGRPPKPPRGAGGGVAVARQEEPDVEMLFYEIKLTEADTKIRKPDYTHDHRRYSYTDFRLHRPEWGKAEARSTVEPDQIAAWIARAHPRNQDDCLPLFLLAKDLLRKFHLKEMRYQSVAEKVALEQVQAMEGLAVENADKVEAADMLAEKAEVAVQELADEKEAFAATLAQRDAEIEALRARVAELDNLEARLQHAHVEEKHHSSHTQGYQHEGAALACFHFIVVKKEEAMTLMRLDFEAQLLSMRGKLNEEKAKVASVQSELAAAQRAGEIQAEALIKETTKTPEEIMGAWKKTDKIRILGQLLRERELAELLPDQDFAKMPDGSRRFVLRQLLKERLSLAEKNGSGWVGVLAEALDMEPHAVLGYLLGLYRREEVKAYKPLTEVGVDVSGPDAPFVALVRDAISAKGRDPTSLDEMALLMGMDSSDLLAKLVGLPAEQIRMIKEHWPLFIQWFERFGNQEGGLEEAEKERDADNERRRKYGLINIWTFKGDAYPLDDALQHIGGIIDFKWQSDFINEAEGRPRFNMVKATRNYFDKKSKTKTESQLLLGKLCVAIRQNYPSNKRIYDFAKISGMIKVPLWTERSSCFYLTYLLELKKQHSPGEEENFATMDPEVDWDVFGPWLGTRDIKILKEQVLSAATEASVSHFGFGASESLASAIEPATIDGNEAYVSFQSASAAILQVWFDQFHLAQGALVQLFHANDFNNDQELEIHEFLALLKSTPMKIRQHDAMNMFSELAGPDGTMDQQEFAEMLTFYKFNTGTLLAEVGDLCASIRAAGPPS